MNNFNVVIIHLKYKYTNTDTPHTDVRAWCMRAYVY